MDLRSVGARKLRPLLVLLLAAAASVVGAAPASAAVDSVFGGAVDCSVEGEGVRFCGGPATTVNAFDGVPIDVNVALPPAPASGSDGGYPLIMMFHGWGGSEYELDSMRRFLDRGYAVFSMSDRGWGDSCGGQTSKTGPCAAGYNRLMDTRYEVRDAQDFAGMLADEGLIDPKRIGAWGGSYGGGISMALAALRDRMALPGENPDGTLKLVPWVSPEGIPMELAAATPDIPWTDLAYSLVPNGRNLDYLVDSPYSIDPTKPVPGVMKLSFVTGLLALGLASSNYALPATNPDADLVGWYTSIIAGDPYEANPTVVDALKELTLHHSSYYIDDSRPPAPLLISNGFTDDLFPPDEALRFYNRTRTHHPGAKISLLFTDHGHQRGQNKADDQAYLRRRQNEWLDYYVKGVGVSPEQGATVKTQTCPADAPSEGPLSAASWRALSPGEVRFSGAEGAQTIVPGEGLPVLSTTIPTLSPGVLQDLAAGLAYDPILGTVITDGACAAPPDPTGSVTDPLSGPVYEFPVKGDGFLMVGSPTVIANLSSAAAVAGTPPYTSQIAARLIDVAQDGSETLVGRALYRPDLAPEPSQQVFQLHPNGWRFESGHTVRLELLPLDLPYGRFSNGQLPIEVTDLELRLPSHDAPNGGQIQQPAPPIVPPGGVLAPDYRPAGPPDAGAGTCANTIAGTKANDRLRGTPVSDRISGKRGNDLIRGRGGADCLRAGTGQDRIFGGAAEDDIRPGRGKDHITAGGGDDQIHAARGGRDQIDCGPGKDVVRINPRKDRVKRNCEKVVEP